MSIHSQLTSSLVETSEDEEAKRKEAEAKKKAKKGFTQAELDEIIDVDLKETPTMTLFFIPSTINNQDTEEDLQTEKDNTVYNELLKNKVGSDSYMNRGS
jgi:hypothetical protein